MIRLNNILNELYSNPICPRKEGESDEGYKQRCTSLMGPSVLMNIPSVSEKTNGVKFEDFAEKRGEGADKIATTAKEKGGIALLTYHHFKVKEPYYKNATQGEFNKQQAIEEFNQTLKSISLNMNPIEFQTEVGRLEVLGELIISTK